ncbi:hypothetical protein LPJ74_005930, partial [Coemansia sp. RSA 1843]
MAATGKNQPRKGRNPPRNRRKSNVHQVQTGGNASAECISPARKRQKNNDFQTPDNSKGTPENVRTSMKEIMDERRHEAEYIAKHAVRKDVDSLFSLVEPKKTAKTIVDPIVEATLTTINNGLSALSEKNLDAVIGKDELKKYGDSFDLDRAVESTFRLSKLNEELFRGVSEADMYPLFRDFIMLVVHHVKAGAERFIAERSVKPTGKRKKSSGAIEPVLILPYSGADFKPEGSDDRTKIDGALALCRLSSPIEPQGSPNYKDMFAIGELKRQERDSLQAFTQLV